MTGRPVHPDYQQPASGSAGHRKTQLQVHLDNQDPNGTKFSQTSLRCIQTTKTQNQVLTDNEHPAVHSSRQPSPRQRPVRPDITGHPVHPVYQQPASVRPDNQHPSSRFAQTTSTQLLVRPHNQSRQCNMKSLSREPRHSNRRSFRQPRYWYRNSTWSRTRKCDCHLRTGPWTPSSDTGPNYPSNVPHML